MSLLTFSAPAQIQQAWVARYNNGILNGTNHAVKMVLDSVGNIYVTGFSQNTNTNLGYVTIRYAPNGKQKWTTRYDSTNYPTATPSGLVLDNSNNVVVTGNALTVKYDTNGNQLWTAPYAGAALAVDTNGNVAVTGFDTIFSTVKINPSGTNLWQEAYAPYCGAATGQAIVADTNDNFYVAGNYPSFCENGITDYELLIIKYGSNGTQTWTSSYSFGGAMAQVEGYALDTAANITLIVNFNPLPGEPFAIQYNVDGSVNWTCDLNQGGINPTYSLACHSQSNIFVAGGGAYAFNGMVEYDYTTIKMGVGGTPVWTNRFPQPPFGSSVANALAIDSGNNCYVTGLSPGTNSANDIVTIKYSPTGNQIWLQRYTSPGNGNAAGNAIAVDNNGNVYVTGYDTTTAGGTEIVTIKYSPVTVQRRSDGTVILQAQGTPGESFDIEASEDLLNWLDLGSVLADTNGLMQFDDTNAPAYPARFYYTTPQ